MRPRVGYFGARSDARGLSYQAIAYAKHLNFDRILGIDMTADDLSPYPCDWSQYASSPGDLTISRYSELDESSIRKWLRGLDIIMGAETFYRDEIPIWAKEEGARTVLAANPEFAPWWNPKTTVAKPDVLIAPTTWRLDEMPGTLHLPFPVDREVFPFRLRTSADRFVHVAGHRAAADRAGTRMVIGALPRLKDVSLVVKSQSPLGYASPGSRGHVSEGNVAHPFDLYADADVIIILRRYGGNSLVHQEALSSGCPVISLDRDPENSWPGVVTIPARARQRLRTKGGLLPVYDGSVQHLIKLVKELAANPARVQALSEAANEYAESISWTTLLPVYEGFFKAVMSGDEDSYLRGIAAALF